MTTPAPVVKTVNATSLSALQAHIEKVFVGKPQVVRHSLITLLAGGHLLIEDVPGVGKTTLALAIAKSTGCSFQRIQFTSDLLPSDILGISIPHPETRQFEFRPGPIFNQVVLADELNRATPRTQSALLEALNERQVTLDNQTHRLPSPFFVIATQNPLEHHGTFPLPESQLDRFLMRLSIGYPDAEQEKAILALGLSFEFLQNLESCTSTTEIQRWIDAVPTIRVASVVDDYILALVAATRTSDQVQIGVSPRGSLALRRAAQARALLENRDHVIPDDIKQLAVPVLAHRLLLTGDPMNDPRLQTERLMHMLLERVPVPL